MARSLAVLAAALAGAAYAAFCLWLVWPARAHEWYPWECCLDRDCWPMGDGAKEPDPAATPLGWRLADGEVVPYRAARPSPDGRFHVCRRAGQPQGALIRPAGKPACLWAPMGAS